MTLFALEPGGQIKLHDRLTVDLDSPPAEVLGALAELCAWLDLLVASAPDAQARSALGEVVKEVAGLTDVVRDPAGWVFAGAGLAALKQAAKGGGDRSPTFSAQTRIAQTVCARAERRLYSFLESAHREACGPSPTRDPSLAYLLDLVVLLEALAGGSGSSPEVWSKF